ncbi:hypothetical protein DBR40_24770 [Pedobacter sp. KBW01]|nr:hypothetical protein DBR40_24770 [Pedobacter sp. KBW01]
MIGYFTGVLASSFWVGSGIAIGLVLLGSHPKEVGALFMATPDTSALAAYAGKYERALFSAIRAKLTIFNDLKMIPGVTSAIRLTKLTVKDGTRGYREDFDSADDDLSYSGRDLAVSLLKRDFKINPLKYRTTWMSEVMKPGINIDDIPFSKFVNEQMAITIGAEIQKGFYLAVKGDESTLAKCFDGPGTLITKAIADEVAVAGTGIVPVVTGALTDTNAVSKFELMLTNTPTEFIQNGLEVKCSVDSARKFNKDFRERYSKYTEKDDMGRTILEDTAGKVVIKPCTWMGTSSRLIVTPYENMLVGLDGIGDTDKIHTDVELEIIKYRWLFNLGAQFRDIQAVRVNDQA